MTDNRSWGDFNGRWSVFFVKINKGRLLLIVCLLISTGSSFWVISSVFRDHIIFFYTVSEYIDRRGEIEDANRDVKLGGIITEISRSEESPDVLLFVIADNSHSIKAQYKGIVPALFKKGQGAVITGKIEDDNIFYAKEILAKHDERYIPLEMCNSHNISALSDLSSMSSSAEAEDLEKPGYSSL